MTTTTGKRAKGKAKKKPAKQPAKGRRKATKRTLAAKETPKKRVSSKAAKKKSRTSQRKPAARRKGKRKLSSSPKSKKRRKAAASPSRKRKAPESKRPTGFHQVVHLKAAGVSISVGVAKITVLRPGSKKSVVEKAPARQIRRDLGISKTKAVQVAKLVRRLERTGKIKRQHDAT